MDATHEWATFLYAVYSARARPECPPRAAGTGCPRVLLRRRTSGRLRTVSGDAAYERTANVRKALGLAAATVDIGCVQTAFRLDIGRRDTESSLERSVKVRQVIEADREGDVTDLAIAT